MRLDMEELNLKDIKLSKSFKEVQEEKFAESLKESIPSVKTWSFNQDKFKYESRKIQLQEDA